MLQLPRFAASNYVLHYEQEYILLPSSSRIEVALSLSYAQGARPHPKPRCASRLGIALFRQFLGFRFSDYELISVSYP